MRIYDPLIKFGLRIKEAVIKTVPASPGSDTAVLSEKAVVTALATKPTLVNNLVPLANIPVGKIISDTTYEAVWKTAAISVVPATGVFTVLNHGFVNTDVIEFKAGTGVLPTGVQAFDMDLIGGMYYNIINATTNTFQICDTVGGAVALIPTTAGTAGWNCRGAIYNNVNVAIPILSTLNNSVEVKIILSGAKIATLSDQLYYSLNSDGNAKYIGTAIFSSIFSSIDLVSKFSNLMLNVELSRISSTSCFLVISQSKIESALKVSSSASSSNINSLVLGLASEVSIISMRFGYGSARSSFRSVRAIIIQK